MTESKKSHQKFAYTSPKGSPIVGVKEVIPGNAWINSLSIDGDPEYAGETKVYWDEQKPALDANGEKIFIDEKGDEWPFSVLIQGDPIGDDSK